MKDLTSTKITKAVITVAVFSCGNKKVEYLEWYNESGLVDALPVSALDEEPDLFSLPDENRLIKYKIYNRPMETFTPFLSEKDHNSIQYNAIRDNAGKNVYHYARFPIERFEQL